MWSVFLILWVVVLGDDDIKFESSPYKTVSLTDHAILKKKVNEFHKKWKLLKTVNEDDYEYIFEWNCFCATCLEIPKYIKVTDNKIVSIKFSDKLGYDYYENEDNISPETKKEFDLKLPNYGCDDLYLHSKHYHNIEGLFNILKKSLNPSYYDPNRHIISMTFDKKLKYPKTVYISNDLHELGWNIKCLSMGNNHNNSCSNNKPYPFWIEQKWQEIIAWFMIGLVLLMSCIGHFIAYLKKRARKKHRMHIRDQMRGNNGNGNNAIYNNKNNNVLRNRKGVKQKNKKNKQQQQQQRADNGIIEEQ